MEVLILLVIFLVWLIKSIVDLSKKPKNAISQSDVFRFISNRMDSELEREIREKIRTDKGRDEVWNEITPVLSTMDKWDRFTREDFDKYGYAFDHVTKIYKGEQVAIPILMAQKGKIPSTMIHGWSVSPDEKFPGDPRGAAFQLSKYILEQIRQYDGDIDIIWSRDGVLCYNFRWNKNPGSYASGTYLSHVETPCCQSQVS